jgi:predicted nucleic acid-binding Zn ribbon protein
VSEKREGSLERIGTLVEGLLRSRGLAEDVERASVVPEWTDLVGSEIARVARPIGFNRSTLFVEVRSSAWLMELEMMERRILVKLNAGRKRGKFEKIVFRLSQGD